MRFFDYIYYRILTSKIKENDESPEITAFISVTFLEFLIALGLFRSISLIMDFSLLGINKNITILFAIILGIFNYLRFKNKNRLNKLYVIWENENEEKKKKRKMISNITIILIFIMFIVIVKLK